MTEKQTWFRNFAFDGWFILINPKSGKALELPPECNKACQNVPAYINGEKFYNDTFLVEMSSSWNFPAQAEL